MKARRFLCTVLAGAMVAGTLAGCGGGKTDSPAPAADASAAVEQEAQAPEGEAPAEEAPAENVNYAEHLEVIIDNTSIGGINPIGSGGPGSATGWVYKMVYDTLVIEDGEGGYLPSLATSWESEDWQTITWHLRDDVVFSNGEPFTADDMVFTVEQALAKPGSVAGGQWASVESVTKVDDYTVEMKLTASKPQILYDASCEYGAMMCKSATEADPEKGAWIGTGPYVITDFASNDYVSVERNDLYWGDPVPTKSMTLRYIPEMSTRLIMLQNGEADICFNLSEQDLPLVEEDTDNFQVFHYKANNCSDIAFNMNDPLMADINFRMAVAYALNKTDIALGANGVYAEAETTGTFWGSGTPFRNDGIEMIPYDPEKAKEYLAKTSYAGETLEIITAIPTMINASAVIQQQLAEVGIKCEIKQTDVPSLMAACVYGSSDFQMYCFVGAFQFEPYSSVLGIYGQGAMQNRVTYDNAEIQQILTEVVTETDTAKQQEAYYKIQEIEAQEIPYINLFYVLQAIAADKNVGGLDVQNDGGHDLRYMYKIVE